MHIAMFTNNYKPFVGGVPISIDIFANEFRKLGHKVSIFAPEYQERTEEEYNTFRVPSLKMIKYGDSYFPIPLSALSDFKKKFVELNVDIIHCHHPFLLGRVGQKLGSKHDIPVVYTYHTRFKEYCINLPSGVRQVCEVALDKIVKDFCNQSDLVFTPTAGMTEHLLEKGVDSEIKVMPTGIDLNNYEQHTTQEVADYKTELGLEETDDILLFVSRLATEKNIDFILEALESLLDSDDSNTQMLIVGDGPCKERLMKKAEQLGVANQVEFLGERSREELIKLYKLADIFVFSSLAETQGIVIIEALAGKTPVVALNGTGVRDIITNQQDGYLVKPGDQEGFLERVKKLLADDELYEEMSQQAYQKAKQYSSSTLAQNMLDCYQDLLETKTNYQSEIIAGK
ncbi:MAG: glycosyltransferase [Bacillota bacterium]